MTGSMQFAESKEIQAKKLHKENTLLKIECRKLRNENISLSSVIKGLQTKVNKLITWIAKKLSCSETSITQDFEREKRPIKQKKRRNEIVLMINKNTVLISTIITNITKKFDLTCITLQ